MPEEKDDPIGKATAGANWFVGLSGAAVGGALAKLDLIQKFPFWGKFWCIVATTFFLWSIVSGVYYYFQLLVLAQTKEKLERAEAGPNPNQTSIDGAKANRDKANEKVGRFFYGAMTTFAMACIATLIGLCFVFFTPSPAPPPPPLKEAAPTNHYSIINVPVHMGGRLLHSHTFLLD
jgi:hypothetical protein